MACITVTRTHLTPLIMMMMITEDDDVTCSSYHWSLFTVCNFVTSGCFTRVDLGTLPSGFYQQEDLISPGPSSVQTLLCYLGLRIKTGFLKHEQLLSDAQQK